MTNDTKKRKEKVSFIERFKRQQSADAKKAVLNELLNDMYENRREIYAMNFVRGLFFGVGSVLGGTLLIALFAWLLTQLGAVVPFLSDFIQQILDALGSRTN